MNLAKILGSNLKSFGPKVFYTDLYHQQGHNEPATLRKLINKLLY